MNDDMLPMSAGDVSVSQQGSKLVSRIGMVLISVFVALLLLRNFVVGFSHVIYADGRVDRGVIYKLETSKDLALPNLLPET